MESSTLQFRPAEKESTASHCHHCGEACGEEALVFQEKHFCCAGCQTVFEILQENNLCTYYDLNSRAGISLKGKNWGQTYAYLDEEEILESLLDFQDGDIAQVRLYIPAIHCSSCVWLLEHLDKLVEGVQEVRLHFTQKTLSLRYHKGRSSLRKITELLATLGYAPSFSLEGKVASKSNPARHALLKKLGLVGFCMGNMMLLSFPEYLSPDLKNIVDNQYQVFFLWLNAFLALPVFFYGASDYLRGAYLSLRENLQGRSQELSVDIPIALGISALFVRSLIDTLQGQGAYWDSLAGLVFFLLLGKWVQQETFGYLSFERDYKSFFPLAVKVQKGLLSGYKAVAELQKGDLIHIHHQELVPADALLQSEQALIDYSLLTGESAPVEKSKGALIYAGGRQLGGQIALEVQKPVAQSYLTQLWNQAGSQKPFKMPLLSAAFSKYFTYITLAVAAFVAFYWAWADSTLAWTAATAVLMVACPCALTLSMPFALATVMAIFGRKGFYVKNQQVIQHLSESNYFVFDKTGTITQKDTQHIHYQGQPLQAAEEAMIAHLAAQSLHPLSAQIAAFLEEKITVKPALEPLQYFREQAGAGLEGLFGKNKVQIGKATWLGANPKAFEKSSQVYVAVNDEVKGAFFISQQYRPELGEVLGSLRGSHEIGLLSGDNDAEAALLKPFFGVCMHFHQSPADKQAHIAALQAAGKRVVMLGDGLNDAGALRQADVGIALSEQAHSFSPASDAILEADAFRLLPAFVTFSKKAVRIVGWSFLLSLLYNVLGIGWAASGQLSPVVAAIFMPLSSLSVVLFAVLLTGFAAKGHFAKYE